MSDLPPLELAQAYVVVGPNDQRGPYTLELLISEVLAQRLSEATPVWWPGLADWTTMGGHPGVVAELNRRRAPAPADPGWTVPSQVPAPPPPGAAPAPVAQPAAEPVAEPMAPAAAPAAESATTGDPFAAAAPTIDPAPVASAQPVADDVSVIASTESSTDDMGVDDDVVDAEIIEVDVASLTTVDGQHLEVYTALVARSAARAQRQSQIDSVDEAIVAAVAAGVATQGFELAERTDVERSHELRFDGSSSDLVVVSLGRPNATRPDGLREDQLPVTVSYRSTTDVTGHHTGSGEHGEVVVSADEWTGQATSSVSLFLGLEDYLGEGLQVDEAAVSRDVAAALAVVRAKLG